MKPCLKTRSDKSACATNFLELSLTNSGIILEWMQHHTIDNTLTFIHSLFTHLILLTLTILTQPPEQNSEAAAGDVLKNFANFTRKHLYLSLFFTKLQAVGPATLLKIDSYTGSFLWNLRNFQRTPILKNIWTTASVYWLLNHGPLITYWFLQFTAVHVFQFSK